MKKVVAVDVAFPGYDLLKASLKELDAELVFAQEKTEEALAELCEDAVAVMTTYTKITAPIIQKMKACRMIIRTGIGVDNIDVDAAKEKGIDVSYVPDYCREEVADHTMALVLCAARKVLFCHKNCREEWDIKKKLGYVPRLRGKVMGILSFGAIGKMIAERARAFGMEIWAYDPFLPEEVFEQLHVKCCKTEAEILAGSDVVILTGPLTPERFHIINEQSLKTMKKTAILVNTARGPLVDEAALMDALKNGTIAGAALDVFEKEPITDESLYDIDNLVITPHIAFYSDASLPDLQGKVFDEVIRAVKGEPLRCRV